MRDDRRLLVVGGDSTADVASRLERAGMDVATTADADAAADRLDEVAGVVVAFDRSEASGLDVVARLDDHPTDRPVVLYAPDGDERVAVDALRAGADDYVSSRDDLVARVRRTVPVDGGAASTAGEGPDDDATHGALIGGVQPAVLEIDGRHRVCRWGDAARTTFGYDADEILEREVSRLVPDDGRHTLEAALRTLFEGERPVAGVNDALTADGERLLCEWYAAPLFEDGEATRAVVLLRNATDRRRRERTLRTLHEATRDLMTARDPEEIYRIAVHTARDVLSMPYATGFRYDEDDETLRPVENTDASAETFGEAPSFDLGEGIAGDAFERGAVEAFADATQDERADPEGASARIRSYIVAPLGEYGLFTVADDAIDAFDDGDVELLKTLAANTEAALDRAQRERELERQNERLDRFASVASHDLRNPLAVARGHLDYLRDDPRPDDEPHLDEIETSLERMDELLERLLALARGGETVADPTPLSVDALARDAWATVGDDDADLRILDDPVVFGDRSRVQQLLENLFRNAVEHGSTGSRTGSADAVEQGSTSPRSGAREDAVEHGSQAREDAVTVEVGALADGGFYVADDGPGIPPEQREAVLESGVSEGGTGLGLAIVRRIADTHGWTLSIAESEAGGARIEVRTS